MPPSETDHEWLRRLALSDESAFRRLIHASDLREDCLDARTEAAVQFGAVVTGNPSEAALSAATEKCLAVGFDLADLDELTRFLGEGQVWVSGRSSDRLRARPSPNPQ